MFRIAVKAPWLVRVLGLYIGLTVVSLNPAFSLPFHDPCTNAADIQLDATARYSGFLEAGLQCFETDLPAAGILMLEVSAPHSASAELRIELDRVCTHLGKDQESFVYLDRLAQSVLLETKKPGSYRFCIAAQDPLQTLGEYRLLSDFKARRTTKEGDPKEVEVIPDPKSLPRGGTVTTNPAPLADPVLQALCTSALEDDHGDTPRCATAVDPGSDLVEAEIGNDRGDDEDFFTFVLDELRTIEIVTHGGSDIFGFLYDRKGYLLKTAAGRDDGTGTRLVKTLSPGQYFLRVGSLHGGEGPYQLRLDRQDD